MQKIAITELPVTENYTNLYALGVTATNESKRVPMGKIISDANEAITKAVGASRQLFADMWDKLCKEPYSADMTNPWGRYNAATGFFELNGLTDITYAQALTIFLSKTSYGYEQGRTNLPPEGNGYIEMSRVGDRCINSYYLQVWRGASRKVSGAVYGSAPTWFANCSSLHTIIDLRLDKTYCQTQILDGLPALRNIALTYCDMTDIRLRNSPLLTDQAIHNIIEAAPVGATVRLHPTPFDRIPDLPDTYAIITAKNITVTRA